MKEKICKVIKSKYLIGSIIVSMIYIIFLYVGRITPFGDKSILKIDLYQQYAEFLTYYREVLLHGKGLFVSWNMGLGNNFFTTFTYYLVSPFNLLIVFFSKENVHLFVELISWLKLLMIFNCTVLFLEKTFKYKKYDVILFAIAYTYSSYIISYLFHIMWLDAFYMLPLILMFTEKYIRNKKIYPISICVSITLLMNYYIGFITVLFVGLYYVSRTLIETEFKKDEIKVYIYNLIKFICGLLVAIGVSMIFLLPSFMQVRGTMDTEFDLFEFETDKFILLPNVLFNNYRYTFTQRAGFYFSSTLITLLIPMFYMNKKITRKEKTISSLMIVIMLLPIISPFINRVWHGMAEPNSFYYRYGFCFILYLIIMAFKAYINSDEIKKKHFLISFIIFIIPTVVEIILNKKGLLLFDKFSVTNKSILLSLAIYCCMSIILYLKLFYSEKKILKILINNKLCTTALTLLVLFDLTISIRSSVNLNNEPYFKLDDVSKYDNLMNEWLPNVKNKETERIIFTPDVYSMNYSLKYGYSSIDYFTSARNKTTIRNMHTLGYNTQKDVALWVTSCSGTWFNYALAGVNYYISEKPLQDDEIYGFYLIDQKEGYYIYKTDLTLPITFYQKNNTELIEVDNPKYVQEKNPFEQQNDIISNLNGNKKEYFYSLDKNSDIIDVSKKIEEKRMRKENDEADNKIKDVYEITYTVKANKDTSLYLYSDYEIQLYKEKKAVLKNYASWWTTEAGIKPIKHLEKGEEYTFSIVVTREIYNKYSDKIDLYASDNESIEKEIQANEDIIKSSDAVFEKNTIKTNINLTKEGYACFEIAYDDGWKAIVNGEERKVEKIDGFLTGVKLDKGENIVELYYIPKYLKEGSIISLISIAVLTFIIAIERKERG